MSNQILELRPYQAQGVDAVERAWWTDGIQRPVGVLPTAGGKTFWFAHLARRFLDRCPGKRVLILSETDELVEQNGNEVRGVAPGLWVGRVQARYNEVDADVISGSVQTLLNPDRLAQLTNVGLVIVDECHHAAAPSYKMIMRYFGLLPENGDRNANGPSDVKALGVTATLIRGDRAALSEVWQKVVFSRDIEFMIANGYLVEPRGKSVEIPRLDLSEVAQLGGDYQEGELGQSLIAHLAPEVAAQNYREHAADLSGVLFWPTVDAADAGAKAMRAQGFTCEVVHGDTKKNDRRDILRDLRNGDLQTVSNCMVLTEGFNAPRLSCAVIGRMTRNPGLYQQMVGRVLRLFEGKEYALILDLVGIGKQYTLDALIKLDPRKLTRARHALLDDLGNEIPRRDSEGRAVWYGPTVAVEFDPLGDSHRYGWLTTNGGTRFLPVGASYFVYLVPGTEPGTWTVAWCNHESRPDLIPVKHGITEHADLSLDTAVAWAQQLADGDLAEITGRATVPRRKIARNGAISGAQYTQAATAGLRYAQTLRHNKNMRSGEFQDLIDVHTASGLIDPLVQGIDPATLLPPRRVQPDEPSNEVPEDSRDDVWQKFASHGWLATTGGTRFLPVGYSYFLYLTHGTEPDTWSVAWCERNANPHLFPTRQGTTEHVDLPLELAVARARQIADGDMAGIAGRATTPKGRIRPQGKITDRQRRFAELAGIEVDKHLGLKSGPFENVIDIHVATGLIDPIVQALRDTPNTEERAAHDHRR